MPLESQPPALLRFGIFEVDLRSGELRKRGVRIKTQDQPFLVLKALLGRPGEIVTREELRTQIWSADTFVDFDNSLNTSINKLREALGDSAESPRFVETVPRRGYRFIAPVSSDNGLERHLPDHASVTRRKLAFAVIAAIVITAAGMTGLYLRGKKPPITEKDTLVLADFLNTTGDPVFDDTLKYGLRAQLEQSPFLNLLSDQQVSEQLRFMARQPGERLTPDLARELCQRVGSKGVLTGSISSLGSHYVIGLSATNCQTGTSFGTEQSESSDKEHVLAALGASATRIRRKLGETLPSIQNYDVPIEQVTTASLEALWAYSWGMKYIGLEQYKEALPQFQRAVELDPNFASAYMRVAYVAFNIDGRGALITKNMERAFALRERVSKREYFQISSRYFSNVDEFEKAASEDELWAESYPRDAEAHHLLADVAMWKGNWEEAAKQGTLSVAANSNDNRNYYNLAVSQLALNRPDAAAQTCDQAIKRNESDLSMHEVRYWIAFVRHDPKLLESEVKVLDNLARGDTDAQSFLLEAEATSDAYYGKLSRSRDVFHGPPERIVGSGNEAGAIAFYSYWAFLNAELGNKSEAQAYVRRAAGPHKSHETDFTIAFAAARAGEVALAEKWAADYDHKFPSSGLSQSNHY